mgnify:CR=1 FL=1
MYAPHQKEKRMMKELIIKFDFAYGPIWKDIYDPNTKTWITGIDVIDQDAALNELNDAAEKEYASLYVFDDCGIPHFDDLSYQNKKTDLRSLVSRIIERANFLNDGSYVVKDLASRELR